MDSAVTRSKQVVPLWCFGIRPATWPDNSGCCCWLLNVSSLHPFDVRADYGTLSLINTSLSLLLLLVGLGLPNAVVRFFQSMQGAATTDDFVSTRRN